MCVMRKSTGLHIGNAVQHLTTCMRHHGGNFISVSKILTAKRRQKTERSNLKTFVDLGMDRMKVLKRMFIIRRLELYQKKINE